MCVLMFYCSVVVCCGDIKFLLSQSRRWILAGL